MQAGDIVGAYRVQAKIGAGGMGEVWQAEHTLLGRPAAIKILHASYAVQEDVVTRFFNEARAAAAIADPGIVQIYDFGNDDGVAYIVMELLDGETLDARRRRSAIDLADALRIMRQVAASLGAAHARGIIHRDLKPENIFLVRDVEVSGGERAKILDFGIAKLAGDESVKTGTHAVLGTPLFMSPEQCKGAGQVDQRSDVYSLGCVLFTLIAGRPVFLGQGAGELIVQHVTEPAPRVSDLVHVPSAIADLVARCLEKDPADRPASAGELAAALAALATDPKMRGIQLPAMPRPQPGIGTSAAGWATTAPPARSAGMATTLSGSTVGGVRAAGVHRGWRIGIIAVSVTAIGVIISGAIVRSSSKDGSEPRAPAAVMHDDARAAVISTTPPLPPPPPVDAADAAIDAMIDASPPPDASPHVSTSPHVKPPLPPPNAVPSVDRGD